MSAEREIAAEDSIRVVCRFRPLNDSEEKAGSKVIVKFPNTQEENCISIAVSLCPFSPPFSFLTFSIAMIQLWFLIIIIQIVGVCVGIANLVFQFLCSINIELFNRMHLRRFFHSLAISLFCCYCCCLCRWLLWLHVRCNKPIWY